MNEQINDGGPAYPSRTSTVLRRQDGSRETTMVEEGFRGISIRDYFAAKAMQGLLSGLSDADCGPEGFASDAYMFADAMLAHREKGTRT